MLTTLFIRRKVFMQPKRFDLVLWIQGTGVAPYLEELRWGQTRYSGFSVTNWVMPPR